MSYFRILTRLYNTPLLITPDKLQIISDAITMKLLSNESISALNHTENIIKPIETTLGIIPIYGTLVNKNATGDSGIISYEHIRNSIQSILEKTDIIGFNIDSPGGEATGVFDLVNYIYNLRNEGIKTFAVTNGSMTSAAYAIAAATETIYATPGTIIGSIAAIMDLVDLTKKDKKEGIQHTIIRSKQLKAPSPHETLTEEMVESLTKVLMNIDKLFTETMASVRPVLTVENIVDLKGAYFTTEDALQLNLIDKIVPTLDIAFSTELKTTSNSNPKRLSMAENTENTIATIIPLTTNSPEVIGFIQTAVKDEKERCIKILNAGATFKMTDEQIVKRISGNLPANDVIELFTDIKAGIDAAIPLESNTDLNSTLDIPENTDAGVVSVENVISLMKTGVKI